MITNSTRWVSHWAPATMLIVPAGAIYAMLDSDSWHGMIAGGPILLLVIYGCLVMLFNSQKVEVDARGFRRSYGPLPMGAQGFEVSKERIGAIFTRRMLIRENGVLEHKHHACVEIDDGTWVSLLGSYPDIDSAREGTRQVAAYWAWTQPVEQREGFPPKRQWRVALIILGWGFAVVGTLAWGVYAEILRLGA